MNMNVNTPVRISPIIMQTEKLSAYFGREKVLKEVSLSVVKKEISCHYRAFRLWQVHFSSLFQSFA